MKLPQPSGNIAIVMLFALLHSIVAIVSRLLDYYDDIPLTILTITMVIVVSMRNNSRTEIMAILTLVATLIGFVIGSWLIEPMSIIIDNKFLAPAISTFLITNILGIGVHYITLRNRPMQEYRHSAAISPRSITVIAISILILRMAYVVLFRIELLTEVSLLSWITEILGSSWAIIVMLAGNIVLSKHMIRNHRNRRKARAKTPLLVISSILLLPAIVAAIIYYDLPLAETPRHGLDDYARLFAAALLIDLIIITVCYIIQLTMTSRRELREEREMKHRTEYQYERLKQQINPHFLFNTLNILDFLVQERETERASAFIRKLAAIYRYILSNDSKPLIKLSEELDFTQKYIDLLKERFTLGMLFDIDIEEELLDRHVVPCALQLLVENATKHNIVSEEQPLRISIHAEGDYLVVKNNLQLRTHGQPSTHLGLSNIKRQYQDITARDIEIQQTDNEFIVKIPIV